MRFTPASTRPACLLLAAALLVAGCGKSGGGTLPPGGPLKTIAPVEGAGAVSVTTRNTTRVGGATAADDAAAVARVAYPGLTAASRPQAVIVVDEGDWQAALAASSLAGAPLHAPILFAEGGTLPQVTSKALEALHPTGAAALGGVQVISIATSAPIPRAYRTQRLASGTAGVVAGEVAGLLATVTAPSRPRQALILSESAPQVLQMPYAGLAAESGAPILFTSPTLPKVPTPTSSALTALHRPALFTSGAEQIAKPVLGELARLGAVTSIPSGGSGGTTTAQLGSIEVARFTDGSFGWGVKEPGHGLVFANPSRPLDGPAAALLSATGEYGPLLLLEGPAAVGGPLSGYLADIQPAYSSAPEFQPVRGVYNHGWLIGDESAITLSAQAQLDTMLEISPRKQSGAEEAVTQSE